MCPYCAAPSVVERPSSGHRSDPTFVIGFVTTADAARDQAKRWIRRAWLAPRSFRRGRMDQVRGIYLPAYLYTAAARASYRASIGENYTVTETYTTTDSKGRVVVRTRTRTVTEWRSLHGNWVSYVHDVLVTASRGLSNAELEAIEPFDLRDIRRFSPKLLSGWLAEDPSLDQALCLRQAREEASQQVGSRLHRHMPGDHHRDLQYQVAFENEDIELLLLPIWILAIRYDVKRPPVRLVINGQTGAVTGRAPKSAAKIAALVSAVLLLIVFIVLLARFA